MLCIDNVPQSPQNQRSLSTMRRSHKETNLAPDESFWQEQCRRLKNADNFGEAARQLLQTGIITSSPKRPNQTKKDNSKLDRKIKAIRKRKKQAEKELAEITDELRDKRTPKKRKKKRNLVKTIDDSSASVDFIQLNVTAVKEELKGKEDPTKQDSKPTDLSIQTGEYFENVERSKETIKEEKPTTSEEDDITDRDTNQEEEEEGQIDIQNQATMEAFKLKIQRPFIELYLKFKEAHSQSPSPDELDETLIQVTTGSLT